MSVSVEKDRAENRESANDRLFEERGRVLFELIRLSGHKLKLSTADIRETPIDQVNVSRIAISNIEPNWLKLSRS